MFIAGDVPSWLHPAPFPKDAHTTPYLTQNKASLSDVWMTVIKLQWNTLGNTNKHTHCYSNGSNVTLFPTSWEERSAENDRNASWDAEFTFDHQAFWPCLIYLLFLCVYMNASRYKYYLLIFNPMKPTTSKNWIKIFFWLNPQKLITIHALFSS